MGGVVVDGGQQWRIMPYRNLKYKMLPNEPLRTVFKTQWTPIFRVMEKAPGLNLPAKLEDIDETVVERTFVVATEYLRGQYEYIFEAPAGLVSSYTIGTWCAKIKPSNVRKHGTESDKAKLPPQRGRHKRHGSMRSFLSPRTQIRKVAKKGTSKRASAGLEEEEEEEE